MLRFGACLSIVLVACDPPAKPPEAPEREERATAIAPARPHASPRPAAVTTRASLQVTLAEVRVVGENVEIEVALSRPLPPTSGRPPMLVVGEEVVTRSRAGAGGRADRLVFTMPAAQYERMPDDAEVIVRAGLLSNEAEAIKPRLSEVR
jgi:hypothetical protein